MMPRNTEGSASVSSQSTSFVTGLTATRPRVSTTIRRSARPNSPHQRSSSSLTQGDCAASGEAKAARKPFARLRELRDHLRDAPGGEALRELSMGMSGDFELAIEEGATLVRVGTALFGVRKERI